MSNSFQFFKVFTLRSYSEAISHAHTLNLATIGEKIYCRIPDEFVDDLEFISCGEVARADIPAEHINVHPENPWIDITASAINQDIGPHMYQFKFRNKRFGEMMSLYLYYVMQNDDPEKSYIYMERENG